MDNIQKEQAKKVILKSVMECVLTWNLSPNDIEKILISIAGDIAVNEFGFLTTGDDGFITMKED